MDFFFFVISFNQSFSLLSRSPSLSPSLSHTHFACLLALPSPASVWVIFLYTHFFFCSFLFFWKKKPTKFRLFSVFLDYRSVCLLCIRMFFFRWFHGPICGAHPTSFLRHLGLSFFCLLCAASWANVVVNTAKNVIYISMNIFVALFFFSSYALIFRFFFFG